MGQTPHAAVEGLGRLRGAVQGRHEPSFYRDRRDDSAVRRGNGFLKCGRVGPATFEPFGTVAAAEGHDLPPVASWVDPPAILGARRPTATRT